MAADTSQPTALQSTIRTVSDLLPLILGSGDTNILSNTNRSEAGTRNSTTSGASTNVTTSDASPAAIAALLAQIQTATQNAANPIAMNPVVAQIMRQAQLGQSPILAKMAGAGLYNSTTAAQMIGELNNNATAASSKAVLDYITNQQQIATSAAANLGQLTRVTNASGTNTNNENSKSNVDTRGTENQTRNTETPLNNINSKTFMDAGLGIAGSWALSKLLGGDNGLITKLGSGAGTVLSALGMSDVAELLGLGGTAAGGAVAGALTPEAVATALAPMLANPDKFAAINDFIGAAQAEGINLALPTAAAPTVTSEPLTIMSSVTDGVPELFTPVAEGAGLLGDAQSFLSGLMEVAPQLGMVTSIMPGIINNNPAQAGLGVAGAGIGTMIFPGLGTVIGSMLGNLAGGFIGPGPENAWSSTRTAIDNGRISFDPESSISQGTNFNAELDRFWPQAQAVNQIADLFGLTVAGGDGIAIGQNTPNATPDPMKFNDLFTPNASGRSALSSFSFSGLPGIDGASFNTMAELLDAIQNSGATPTGTVAQRLDPREVLSKRVQEQLAASAIPATDPRSPDFWNNFYATSRE